MDFQLWIKKCLKKYIKRATTSVGFLLLFFNLCLLSEVVSAKKIKSTNSTEKSKIQISSPTLDLNSTIERKTHKKNIVHIFESALFKDLEQNNSSLMWLNDPETYKKRKKIIGSHSMIFESWWRTELKSFYLEDRSTNRIAIWPKINGRFITRFYPSLFARAEFEILTRSGSIQDIFQRVGEINGISHREILFLWMATDWLTLKAGAINQKFLNAPLLVAENPFMSVVADFNIYDTDTHSSSIYSQLAIPNTFADRNSIYTQGITKVPFFITHSFVWSYDPKSFYIVQMYGTFFHFHAPSNDIATASVLYGNSPAEGDISSLKYDYTGFYLTFEPYIKIFSNVGLQLKAHYIENITIEQSYLKKGVLYGTKLSIDVTENIRITPSLEYFINQPDSSIAYYNSERYGHNDRKGYAGELTLNLYDRNIEIGLRYMYTNALRQQTTRQEQNYFLLFFRTNYAKI